MLEYMTPSILVVIFHRLLNNIELNKIIKVLQLWFSVFNNAILLEGYFAQLNFLFC